ncbi:MAG: NusG domain II-containing protein [Ruminococcaceae bacterium]|nr:NusG domain II-containing protein [Oscillospiraceae bacterium]
MTDFFKKHKFDIILIGLILVALIGVLIFFSATKSEGSYAIVTINGEQKDIYPLDKNLEVKLENKDNYNLLIIENGTARIEEASCPDKLCVNQHKIKYNGETLVCLPNKTIVSIVSEIDSETDFIS